jgi:hypothetical protein
MQVKMKMKYVMNENDTFVLIPIFMPHTTLGFQVISAGFVNFDTYEDDCKNLCLRALCYGESTGLGVESREEDSSIITKGLQFNL